MGQSRLALSPLPGRVRSSPSSHFSFTPPRPFDPHAGEPGKGELRVGTLRCGYGKSPKRSCGEKKPPPPRRATGRRLTPLAAGLAIDGEKIATVVLNPFRHTDGGVRSCLCALGDGHVNLLPLLTSGL